MQLKKWIVPNLTFLLMMVVSSGAYGQAIINSATIGNTTVTNQSSPWIIEGQTFTWNGVNVVVSRYPSTGSSRGRIEIVNDANVDTIGIFNAQFTAASAVTNFPINFKSTGLVPAPSASPSWYYTQGSGSFIDNTPLNGILTTVGSINSNPSGDPNNWNQIGNTLVHNTGTCSCLTFSPSLGYKTYESSPISNPRGLKADVLLTLGNQNDAVKISYLKVNSGAPPGTDEFVEEACEDAKQTECEELQGRAGWLCNAFGIACPRCFAPGLDDDAGKKKEDK